MMYMHSPKCFSSNFFSPVTVQPELTYDPVHWTWPR